MLTRQHADTMRCCAGRAHGSTEEQVAHSRAPADATGGAQPSDQPRTADDHDTDAAASFAPSPATGGAPQQQEPAGTAAGSADAFLDEDWPSGQRFREPSSAQAEGADTAASNEPAAEAEPAPPQETLTPEELQVQRKQRHASNHHL